jgi:hypothetical protein
VIVDEAHTAARPKGDLDHSQHERYNLVRDLADDPTRHLLLVTATPHSGIEESFRSLLGLLDRKFDVDGSDLDALQQRALLPYIVQRRRADLVRWLGSTTPFPDRKAEEKSYPLGPEYRSLFEDVLDYCRESIASAGGLGRHQRVRHWAAIAILRCLLSSPAAAVAVLSNRGKKLAENAGPLAALDADVDALYRPQILDPLDDETVGDYAPTAPLEEVEPTLTAAEKRRLNEFVRRATTLSGPTNDAKLREAARLVEAALRDGFRPIVFCRFIATANYLAEQLERSLKADFPGLRVVAVTGEIGDEERRIRIADLARAPRRVLVATDCLSEGINLQEHFDAVLHYDLPWNPNRLEQREGRVDRFGQASPSVRATLLFGADNPIDLVVLDVLLRKARTIRQRLGVSVPVPIESEQVVQAVVDSVLLRSPGRGGQFRLEIDAGVQLQLPLADPSVSRLHASWDEAADHERKQRAFFSQQGVKPDEVAQELEACDPVLGDAAAVQRFLTEALQRYDGGVRQLDLGGRYELAPGDLRLALEARDPIRYPLIVTFDALPSAGETRRAERPVVLGRTHPIVAGVSAAVLGAALGSAGNDRFARSGAIFTDAVTRRTAVALLRLRYLLHDATDEFAEEVVLAAFQRGTIGLEWLEPLDTIGRDLLERARPIAPMAATERIDRATWALELLARPGSLGPVVASRKKQLEESHERLRKLVKSSRLAVLPREPPDILGCYVLVPAGGGR